MSASTAAMKIIHEQADVPTIETIYELMEKGAVWIWDDGYSLGLLYKDKITVVVDNFDPDFEIIDDNLFR